MIATVERVFMLDGRRFRAPLCDEHAKLLELNLRVWMNCAEEDTLGHVGLTAEEVAPVRPAADLVVLRRTELVDEEPVVEPVPVVVPDMTGVNDEVALRWRFTKAASKNLANSGLTAVDVWRVLQDPEKTERGQTKETEVWVRDGIRVVVSPSTEMVVAVFVPYAFRRKTA